MNLSQISPLERGAKLFINDQWLTFVAMDRRQIESGGKIFVSVVYKFKDIRGEFHYFDQTEELTIMVPPEPEPANLLDLLKLLALLFVGCIFLKIISLWVAS